MLALGFTAAAQLLLGQGRPQQAQALLAELEELAGKRADTYYGTVLSQLVRTALAVEDPELATRLIDGVEPQTPLFEHALCACRAQLAEARGEQANQAQSQSKD